MAFNVVVFLLVIGTVSSAVAEVAPKGLAARSLPFPFKAPIGALIVEPSALATKEDYGHFCFNFVYGAVKLFTRRSSKGTLSDQLASLCQENDGSRCKRWAGELQKIVEAKEAQKRHGKPAGSYQSWCDEIFEAQSSATGMHALPVEKAQKKVVLRKSEEAQVPHALAHSSASRPPHRFTVAPKDSSPKHVWNPKRAQLSHETAGAKSAAPSHVKPEHLPAEAHVTAKKATSKVETAHSLHEKSSQPSAKERAISDPENCACVHRDGGEVCHCFGDDTKVASLAAHNLGNIVRGYSIAKEAETVSSQRDIDGAFGSLSKALRSANKLDATRKSD